jgi:F-type H+-transporting ATPase subunit c
VRASAYEHGVNHPLAAIYKEREMRKMMFVVLLMLLCTIFTVPAFAQTGGGATSPANWVAITSGFAIAIAAGLAAQGQGKAAAGACEALGRNPAARAGIQVALILGLAFIESLVLFVLVIIFVKVV